MALTNAQMQAVIAAGGSVTWPPGPGGTTITTIGALPSDAAIIAYFAGLAASAAANTITPNDPVAGSINANGGIVAVPTSGYGHWSAEIAGTFNGALVFEYTIDGALWRSMSPSVVGDLTNGAGVSSIVNNGAFSGAYDGGLTNVQQIRVRASAWTSGTATVTINLTPFAPIVKMRAALPAGENHIGAVGGNTVTPQATFTRQANGTAYTARQIIGTNPASVMTFTNCARVTGGTGIIVGAMLIDETNQATKLQGELYLFTGTAAPASPADASAIALSTGDAGNLFAVITFPASFVTNAAATTAGSVAFPATGLNVPFACGAGNRNLYGILVAAAGYTPISGEVFLVTLQIAQD